LIIVGTLFFQALFLIYRFPFISAYRAFLEANLLLLFFVGLMVALLSLPTWFLKRRIIKKAKQKIRSYPDLRVIGITGSFGKTSTKEFLAQILSSRFKVLATREHNNTDIGVAKQILKELESHHEVYIVEMGAYKKGEIRSICDLVSPEIGIITGLGTQHFSLFGSFPRLLEAKFELIDSLPGKGLVVLNGDNKFCLAFARQTALKKIIYSTRGQRTDFYAEDIKVFREGIEFRMQKEGKRRIFRAPLLGKQNVNNLLAAISTASYLGLSLGKIAQEVAKIKSLPGTMRLLIGKGKVNLIDDSYNSNPEGVLAALAYLKVFPGRKFMIFQPMIELGRATFTEHRRVFRKATRICDLIFLTNQNFYDQIMTGVNKKLREKVLLAKSPKQMIKSFFSNLSRKDVILLEGKEAARYVEFFLKI